MTADLPAMADDHIDDDYRQTGNGREESFARSTIRVRELDPR